MWSVGAVSQTLAKDLEQRNRSKSSDEDFCQAIGASTCEERF